MIKFPYDSHIDYQEWIKDALRTVARRALIFAKENGLSDENHFYITFMTAAEGVYIPDFLLAQYPEEITIVLQHQFQNLQVTEEAFTVSLRFNGQPADLRVPFSTITAFADPSEEFSLQFGASAKKSGDVSDKNTTTSIPSSKVESEDLENEKKGEVIDIGTFRKK